MTIAVAIIAIGKNKDPHLQALIADYLKRMTWRVTFTEIPAPQTDDATRKTREAELLRAAVPDKAVLIALDERGENVDSITFAKKLDHLAATQSGQLAFVIGGADGLDETLRNQAHFKLSFGKLTWPHMLVRLMLAEQLYRAETILAGHPYHRQ